MKILRKFRDDDTADELATTIADLLANENINARRSQGHDDFELLISVDGRTFTVELWEIQ